MHSYLFDSAKRMWSQLAILLSLALTVYGQADCAHLPDGHYNIGCKTYEKCTAGVFATVECPVNQVYNNVTNKCDYQNHVAAPCGLVRDCTHLADGSYTDFKLNCTSYYTCSHHVYFGHNFCTPGTVFEQSMGTCVWPADAFSPCGTRQ